MSTLKTIDDRVLQLLTERGSQHFSQIRVRLQLEDRALDRALQHLRKTGQVSYTRAHGWALVRDGAQ